MRPIFSLLTVFALFFSYVEWDSRATLANKEQLSTSYQGEIIRDLAPATVAAVAAVTTTAKAVSSEVRRVIDMSLPPMQADDSLPLDGSRQALKLEPVAATPSVSYSAELLFDRETGEEITGGAININIPLG